jgi:uncharacterized protein YggE
MTMPYSRFLPTAFLALCAITISSAQTSAAQDPTAGLSLVVVSGESTVRRPPDIAYLTLTIESRGANPRDAQRQNADKSAAVQRALGDAGIARESIRTAGAWLEQEYDMVNGRRVSRGYVARTSLEVGVEDVVRAGEIADVGVQAGATGLDGVRFDLKDRPAAERDALRLAVENARDRAQAAAAGAGRNLDRIVKIEDTRVDGGGPRPMVMQARAAASAGTNFEPGMLEIQGRVTLTASMK